MFGTKIRLFKLLGFEVSIDISWIIIAALIAWSLATGLFPYYYAGLSSGAYWIMGVLGALGLFASIIAHEFSHSLVARHFGLPMKGITLFIFGGIAEMEEEPSRPRVELLMALAGPAMSVVLGAALLGLTQILPARNLGVPAYGILRYLGAINLILAAFNLVPAFPLDGGRVLRAALWAWKGNLRWATRIASNLGSGFGWLLVGLGVFNIFLGSLIGGLWWIVLGLFVRSASTMSYRRLVITRALTGEPVGRFVRPNPVTVPPEASIREFVDDYVYRYHHKMFPVRADGNGDGRALSCISTEDVKHVPRERWSSETVGHVARPRSNANSVQVDTDAVTVLSRMNALSASRLMVVDRRGNLVGIITLRDLLKFLSIKLDLDHQSDALEQVKAGLDEVSEEERIDIK